MHVLPPPIAFAQIKLPDASNLETNMLNADPVALKLNIPYLGQSQRVFLK